MSRKLQRKIRCLVGATSPADDGAFAAFTTAGGDAGGGCGGDVEWARYPAPIVDAEAAGKLARQRVMEVSRREGTKLQAAQVRRPRAEASLSYS